MPDALAARLEPPPHGPEVRGVLREAEIVRSPVAGDHGDPPRRHLVERLATRFAQLGAQIAIGVAGEALATGAQAHP